MIPRKLFGRPTKLDEGLDEEIRLHIELEKQENIANGMSEQEALHAAQRRFGNRTQYLETSRAVWTWRFAEQLMQDLRFGVRQMRRNPMFTATAVVTLALGLGATTAIFSLTNALLLKPLPVPDPQQLVVLTHGQPSDLEENMSYPLFQSLRKQNHGDIDLVGISGAAANLVSGAVQKNVTLDVVTSDFYDVLKVYPHTGRLFGPHASANAAVLSYRIWRSRFNADPAIIGTKILLDGVPFQVAGVLPQSFLSVEPGEASDIAITIEGYKVLFPEDHMLTCRNCMWMSAMGRLRPGTNAFQAAKGLELAWQNARRETVPEDLPSRYRKDYFAERLYLESAAKGLESVLQFRFVKPLYLLLGMSSLILLIACSNVANLLLSRAQARTRELAIRLSTGASRRRIAQQFLTESLLLSLLAMTASIALYQAFISGLIAFMGKSGQPVELDTSPDIRMIGFATALLMVTVLLFGLAPALRASGAGLRGHLAETSHTFARRSRLTLTMLASQIAVSTILLTGALLLVRSLHELKTFDAGFRRDHLLIATPDLDKGLKHPVNQYQFEQRVLDRLRAMPGVRSASASSIVPVSGELWADDYTAIGFVPKSKEDTSCYVNNISPNFFETMGTRLIAGREFSAADTRAGAPPVAIVSETLARQFWGDRNPVGLQIHELDNQNLATVVGVVRNIKSASLRGDNSRAVYLPLTSASHSLWNFRIEIWTEGSPESLIPSVRKAFAAENDQITVNLRNFTEIVDRRLLYERLLSIISVSFATLGLLMAAVGIYGVAAYTVSRRLLEVGIRRAIGASGPQIIWLFLREHILVAIAGASAGVAASIELTPFLRTWLFGVSALDAPSFTASVVLLLAVSAIAVFIPASRSLRAEPSALLRTDS